MAIIELLARVDGVDPLDLEPLYNAIDPDAIDALCDGCTGFDSLEFTYCGRPITVTNAGSTIEISVDTTGVSADTPAGTRRSETGSST